MLKGRRALLGLLLLAPIVLLLHLLHPDLVSQWRDVYRPSSEHNIEAAIREYYRSVEPDWRANPPLAMQNRSSVQNMVMESWYGSTAHVGRSPYDFVPRDLRAGERKTRVLFLLEFKDYLERMNSHSYEIVDAAMVHPRIEVDVWGHGWAGWDDKLSLSANLAARVLPGTETPVGYGYYDVYWTISNYPDRRQKWVDNAGCGTVHYHQFGDCHSDECFVDVFVDAGNITTTKHAFELLDLVPYDRLRAEYPKMPMQLFAHSPDAANPWDYYPLTRWTDKTHGAVLFGATHELYTIRPVVGSAHSVGKTFITKFRHPGFEIHRGHIPSKKLSTYQQGHPSYKPQVQKRQEFAEGMRKAQVCVFDSSMEKKAIRKYAQAFLSGCVVAADVPTEQEEPFRNFMIVLRPQASIEEINTIVYEAMMDPVELQRKALAAFAYAREHLTNTRKVERMLSDVKMYREGARGYSFAYPLSLSCRKYWRFTVPWCKGPQQYRPIYTRAG